MFFFCDKRVLFSTSMDMYLLVHSLLHLSMEAKEGLTFQMVETCLVHTRGVTTHQTILPVVTRIRALVMATTAVQTPFHISWYVGFRFTTPYYLSPLFLWAIRMYVLFSSSFKVGT